MSQFSASHFNLRRDEPHGGAGVRPAGQPLQSDQSDDTALDAALRAVPLPEGLMTRLGLLAYAVPDDKPDQLDWLGC